MYYVDTTGASEPCLVPLHCDGTSLLQLLDSFAAAWPISLKPLVDTASKLRNRDEYLEESKGHLHAVEHLD